MSNAYEYIKWRGDLSTALVPVNRLDIFLCTQISMVDFEGILDKKHPSMTIKEVAEKYFETHTEDHRNLGAIQPQLTLPSLREMINAPRFAGAVISSYVNKINTKEHEQFSAITVTFEDGTTVITFRGTDDTIVGWREDFEIALNKKTPAQSDAVKYLEDRVAEIKGPDLLTKLVKKQDSPKIYVAGHSKGGNLAAFSILNCSKDTYERITMVYSFDGPGFIEKFKDKKITTIVSENSIIGMLMHPAGHLEVVKTGILGPKAHDGFTWDVDRDGFAASKLSKASRKFAKAVNTTIINMSEKEREKIIEGVFGALDSTGAVTLLELNEVGPAKILSMLNALSSDRELNNFAIAVMEIMFQR